MMGKCGEKSAMLGSEVSTTLSFPPPLWGRGRERGSHELRPLPGPPLSPTLPRKGGGSERAAPPLLATFRQKFSNDSNVISTVHGVVFDLLSDGRPA